jgi:type VI secretion system protein ImpK
MTQAVMPGAMAAATERSSLKDLAQDFITLALMVRKGCDVTSFDAFETSVDMFFSNLERDARTFNYSIEQVRDTQYALCAFFDESVLNTGGSQLHRHFEQKPLQFRYFGVHLAGEGFYEKIDSLRGDLNQNLGVLEVYHLCLALGFKGKFGIDQTDQLRYLANTLGQDIARYRKSPKDTSPDWELPDQASQILRHEVPVWLYLALIALVCMGIYLTLDGLLGKDVAALSEQIRQLFSA